MNENDAFGGFWDLGESITTDLIAFPIKQMINKEAKRDGINLKYPNRVGARMTGATFGAIFGSLVLGPPGAILMGFGGVLALGCTVGQGITGVSTLAVGSIAALLSIIFGSALTMKIQYYQMVYEEEASFIKALLSSLVDMKLLPSSLRKLDAV